MDKNKSQSYSDVQEARSAEARERSRIRSLGEAFGKAALGGQTLSEALRSPLAQTSTRERRRIKKAYIDALEGLNSTGQNETYDNVGIDDSTEGNAKTKDGGGDGDGRETEDLIVIINGVAVTKTFVVESE